jgi:hypothetical protein
MNAGIALRRVRTRTAHQALERAARAARLAGIPALHAEVQSARLLLTQPAGRLIDRDGERFLRLEDIESILKSKALVVDAMRGALHQSRTTIPLSSRPVLLSVLRTLAQSWPEDASRATLISRAFRGRRADESHRARLRVEIGRLRRLIVDLAGISATERGFTLVPHSASRVVVLARPAEDRHAVLRAMLGDGEAWSSSALALACGASQRSVQRALDALLAAGKVHCFGRGRARRWLAPYLPGFATTLLLPPNLPSH